MLRITGNRTSRLEEDWNLGNVVEEMIKYVIENEVLKSPFISCFTVYQVMRGGVHWKNAEYKIRAGLLEHAGISQPPNWYLADQGRRFGYIMDWPPIAMRTVITGSMRKNIINPILDGTIEVPYKVGWCKGYISEDNGKSKYIPEYGKFISSYFIVRNDENYYQDIKKFILQQPWWYRKQWKMTLEKMPEMIIGMKRMADKVHSRASALGKMWKIDENEKRSLIEDKINPEIPEDMIDWREIEDDD